MTGRLTKRRQDGRVGFAVSGTPSENMCKFPIVLDKLGEYEDLEEDGRLIRLPCKIGDIVYRVAWKKYDVDGYGMQWEEDWGIVSERFRIYMLESMGKNIFLSMEEAENCLLRKRGEKTFYI